MPIIITSGPPTTTGTLSKTNLRRKVSGLMGGYLLGTVASSPAPSTSQVAAAEFADNRVDNSFYVGAHVYNPYAAVMGTGDTIDRIVSAYDKSTGKVVPHRNFNAIPAVGSSLELHKYSVDKIHSAINDGLGKCEFEFISVVSANGDNSQVYDLSSLSAYIKDRRNILGVYPASPGLVATDQLPQEIEWWDLNTTNGTTWNLTLGSPIYSSSALWVHILTGYPPLDIDSDTTNCIEEWALSSAMVQLYQRLIDDAGPGRENSTYTVGRARWMATFRHLSTLHQPKRHDKLNMSVPTWGPSWGRGSIRRGVF